MIVKTTQQKKRLLAFVLAAVLIISAVLANHTAVFAADGTLTFNSGETISYGDYFTTRITFDGSNTAYCVEPMKTTPAAGSYEYNLLGKDSPVRKALYYLPGGYAYDKQVKNQYLSGWSEDNAYVIGHLVVAYIYAGYTADTGAFYGAPQSYIDKALEITNAINALPAPPESFRAFLIPGSYDQSIAGSWYQKPYGWVQLEKSSANPSLTDGNGNYSLEGAQYGIYHGNKLIETLTTNQKGHAKSGDLEADIPYTIREIKASPGFILDVNSYDITVKSDVTNTLKVKELPQNNPLDLVLQKLDKETGTNAPQGSAALKDAEFTVKFYASQSDTDPGASGEKPLRTWIFKTDTAGEIHFTNNYLVSGDALYFTSGGKTPCLPLGTVTLQESKAPVGYFPSETVFIQKITGDGKNETVSVYNAPNVEEQIYRGGVKVQKRDLETGEAKPQGDASLKDAEFTITTLNENPVLVDGTSYSKDQVVMTLKTDASGIASTAKDALPYGRYRIDEITPPEGYLHSGKLSVEFDIVEDGKIVDLTAKEDSILNQVIRGDLEFVKVSDGDLNRLANVPFAITSKTTGESHVLVTDKNGYASTSAAWNKHTANTNRGETSKDGIWFGSSEPDDSKGALIYDTYTIEEQRCETNEGMNLLKFDATVYKDSVTIDLGTLTNDRIVLATTALDKDTDSHFSQPKEKVTLVDTVEYEGLKKGQEYRLIGTLMDKETGKAIEIDGKPVTAETTFTPKKSTGKTEVIFTFDATSFAGKTVVVFEELYQEGVKLAVHTDINDEDQTIFFPVIKTMAKDFDTGMNLSNADKEVTLIDTVSFTNLMPDKEYQLSGSLMDQESGEPITLDDKPVTAQTTFTPEESSGTVDVTFTFDAASLKGKTTVIFESLSYEGKEIAVHADLADEGQTIQFPKIKTTASDSATGSHTSAPDKEVTLIDTVTYENLIPGKEYRLSGTLMDKETKKALEIDGKPITSEITFTPEEPSGTVELSFTFDGSNLLGKTIVVFESVSLEGKEVAIHADLEDKEQSIYFPEISTSAKDGKDGDQEILAETNVTIIDTVTYKNLTPDSKYKVSGTLMDKETGKELIINGTPVTAETEFTAKESNGTVEVKFTFDGSTLDGHAVVVFEKLYDVTGEKEVLIAVHEDITDEGQTVKFTKIPEKETPPEKPSTSAPVKTGDETNLLLYAGLAVAALLLASGLGLFIRKKHRAAKKHDNP
ncbi:VaFE repeat-containing surface-anchored protein [Clostridium sp. C105KSO13]|uniref:VaFE repeat-containing surface-anchored protein n=1 Tax=Clostridium sp. C105KSO13 TaxID=1776045 RepID=UPI0007405D39|nr:VaFE repeat-containing surface-anchored protein [Clostridium sp. C105KSO13]CUX25579.1 Cna protein B-type domain protein [Clostridium sp. C105KSO13]